MLPLWPSNSSESKALSGPNADRARVGSLDDSTQATAGMTWPKRRPSRSKVLAAMPERGRQIEQRVLAQQRTYEDYTHVESSRFGGFVRE